MAYSKTLFGTMPDGRPVYAYTLVNSRGTECTLLDLGAIWNRMAVRDRYGNKRDVILGYDQPESYLTDAAFFGAVVGRNANRIAREGAMMYDKFVGFVTTLETIGKNIDTMQGNYDKAMKQLRTGTGNLVSRAQRLSALNIKVSKSLPQSMLEESDDLPVEE